MASGGDGFTGNGGDYRHYSSRRNNTNSVNHNHNNNPNNNNNNNNNANNNNNNANNSNINHHTHYADQGNDADGLAGGYNSRTAAMNSRFGGMNSVGVGYNSAQPQSQQNRSSYYPPPPPGLSGDPQMESRFYGTNQQHQHHNQHNQHNHHNQHSHQQQQHDQQQQQQQQRSFYNSSSAVGALSDSIRQQMNISGGPVVNNSQRYSQPSSLGSRPAPISTGRSSAPGAAFQPQSSQPPPLSAFDQFSMQQSSQRTSAQGGGGGGYFQSQTGSSVPSSSSSTATASTFRPTYSMQQQQQQQQQQQSTPLEDVRGFWSAPRSAQSASIVQSPYIQSPFLGGPPSGIGRISHADHQPALDNFRPPPRQQQMAEPEQDEGLLFTGRSVNLSFIDDPSSPPIARQPRPTSLSSIISGNQVVTSPGTAVPAASATAPTSEPKALTFPARPGGGLRGREIRVKANFFEFAIIPGQDVFHYDIRITPEVPPNMNRRIFKELVHRHAKELQSVAVYDGRRNLYAPIRLSMIESQPSGAEFELCINDDPTAAARAAAAAAAAAAKSPANGPQNNRTFTVRIKFVTAIDMNCLMDFLNGNNQSTAVVTKTVAATDTTAATITIKPAHMAPLQAMDVLMRHRPSMMLTTIGRSFFTRNDVKSLGDGAECWMGFHQSVRPARGKLLINIDVSATAFYEPGPVLDFLAKTFAKRSAADFRAPLKLREVEKAERMLRTVKIEVNHRGEIRRRYKIHGISRTAADQTFFRFFRSETAPNQHTTFVEGQELSVADYFKRQYNIQLRFAYLPCLKVGSTQRFVYLPLEVCEIVPGQRFLRKLNESQTAQMIRLTCQTPERRASRISQAIGELGLEGSQPPAASRTDAIKGSSGGGGGETTALLMADQEYLKKFGVRISNEMVTIPARVLDPPTIQYHPTSRDPLITPRDGSWNLRDKKVVQPATLHSWAVVCFGSPREMPQQKIDGFLREMISTCRDTGLTITNHHPPAIYGDSQHGIESTLRTAWNAAGEAVQSFPQLILCILPNTGVPLYAEIKRVGDTVLGVPTQCIQVKHTFQPKKQYCANVCLKINAKLGGVNSFIVKNPALANDEGLPWVSDTPTIIFGADITHPTHGESKATGSVCALVASLDRLASRYAATVRLQLPRKERIMELSTMVQELMKIFYVENHQIAPQRILFYRDGLGENQFHEVVPAEIAAIRAACEQLQAGYRPTLTYIIVQKRHHCRVFAVNLKDADRSGNIPAGTVIDSHITHPNEYDFYLCSHAGLQGTSRPTHYHVLHDENGFTPDMLHELTYRLCYGYARCTRSVSVVPPAYYADLVAFRAKYHMKSGAVGPVDGSSVVGSVGREDRGTAVLSPVDSAMEGGGGSSETGTVESLSQPTRRGKKMAGSVKETATTISEEEDEEMLKRLQTRLTVVKPELQKTMYFI